MRFYSFYSNSHRVLKEEWFEPTFRDRGELIIRHVDQLCASGSFRAPGWNGTMREKLALLIQAARENRGEIFVYADIDIQWFEPIEARITELMTGKDMVFQRDTATGRICAGLLAARGTRRVERFFERCLARVDARDVDDQEAMNTLLYADWPRRARLSQRGCNRSLIRWDLLPDEFYSPGMYRQDVGKPWTPGQALRLPPRLLLHHANWTVGVEHKIEQMRMVRNAASRHRSIARELDAEPVRPAPARRASGKAAGDAPRITFGVIVLNGEPFTRYCLRALYPFAHQIIVVEGAASRAVGIATPDGHSRDDTLAVIRAMQGDEDPERKIELVTAEDEGHPDGFWPGEKHEMSQAYARRARGDWLWQVDVDEFYQPADMERVVARLAAEPDLPGLVFDTVTFWGGFDYVTDSVYLRSGARYYRRLFRWRPGYRYTTHRPPTVADERGTVLSPVRDSTVMHHYSLLLPKQVEEKCGYYTQAPWAHRAGASRWAERTFGRLEHPFRVHNVYQHRGWLERFSAAHPPAIEDLRDALAGGAFDGIELRRTDDIERLLASPIYRSGRATLKLADRFGRAPTIRALRALAGQVRRKLWSPS